MQSAIVRPAFVRRTASLLVHRPWGPTRIRCTASQVFSTRLRHQYSSPSPPSAKSSQYSGTSPHLPRDSRHDVRGHQPENAAQQRLDPAQQNDPSFRGFESETDGQIWHDPSPYHEPSFRQTPALFRPIMFTLGVGIAMFGGASYLSRRETEQLAETIGKSDRCSVAELRAARHKQEVDQARDEMKRIRGLGIPPLSLAYGYLKSTWINASDGARVAAILTAANAVVFVAWQIPLRGTRLFMARHFLHHPLSGRSYTLLTSAFSHNAFWHFALNMFAMQGFVAAATSYISSLQALDPRWRDYYPRYITADANSTYFSLAFFVTAGVVAGLGSHIVNAVALRRTLGTLAFRAVRASIGPSLGASGAIYSTIVLTAFAFPEDRVGLFFVIPLPITWGVSGLVALDIMGVLRGWATFDHWAHLTGAAFGALYYYVAPRISALSHWDVSVESD